MIQKCYPRSAGEIVLADYDLKQPLPDQSDGRCGVIRLYYVPICFRAVQNALEGSVIVGEGGCREHRNDPICIALALERSVHAGSPFEVQSGPSKWDALSPDTPPQSTLKVYCCQMK